MVLPAVMLLKKQKKNLYCLGWGLNSCALAFVNVMYFLNAKPEQKPVGNHKYIPFELLPKYPEH